jgi:hypothetical protein
MTDYSTLLFHPSASKEWMTDPKGKSNLEKWQEAKENLALWQTQYDGMNPATKTAGKKLDQISRVIELIADLEPHKDEVLLSETCKNKLIMIDREIVTGRKQELHKKQIKKGNQTEEDAISLYSRIKKDMFKKNEQQLTNSHFIGTPDFGNDFDIKKSEVVIDTKASWSLWTFPSPANLPDTYYGNMQCYMDLIGEHCKKAIVAYCLTNTPAGLITMEKRHKAYDMGVEPDCMDDDYYQQCIEIEKNNIFDMDMFLQHTLEREERTGKKVFEFHSDVRSWTYDLPLKMRLVEVEFDRDEDYIAAMKERITLCRAWMNKNLLKEVKQIAV